MKFRNKMLAIYGSCLLAGMLCVFFWFHYRWLSICTPEEMKGNAAIVNAVPAPPPRFLKIWDKLYPGSRSHSMSWQLVSELNGHEVADCKCDEIGSGVWGNHSGVPFTFSPQKLLGNYLYFGFGLEEYSTPEHCFNFWLNHDISWQGRYLKDLEELSQITVHKEVSALNDSETVVLIASRVLEDRGRRDKRLLNEAVESFNRKLGE